MDLWFTEKQTCDLGITLRIKQSLHSERTEFQELELLETAEFGNMLVLDGMIMTTERDEFVYHEMMAHPALFTHPCPRSVLVVGGGDGGVIREVLKHPSVTNAVLVEIDGKVVEFSKKYLPSIAGKLDDPRVEVQIADGFMHIHNTKNCYDVIIVDSTEPVGPAVKLFERTFYHGIFAALKDDGLFVAQTDNPWFKGALLTKVTKDVAEIFPICRVFCANIPTYPSGLLSFTMGSKKHDPLRVNTNAIPEIESKYFTPKLMRAAFVLPRFVQELVQGRC